MDIEIKNCNNIETGKIEITKDKLNLKFGINGTGKSTITKALQLKVDSPENLKELLPFKYRNAENEITPQIIPSEEINSILIFNEEYLNQFLFREDELISNSYEIFIKTPEYQQLTVQIEQLLSDIKRVFSENEELEMIISDFESLSKSFTTTQTGLSKTSALYKGLKEGNKIAHVPEVLKGYSKLIKNKDCVSWLEWQSKGEQFLEISDDCPYCTSATIDKKEAIKSVSTYYNKTVVKNFNVIIDALKNLGEYFSADANATLKTITEKQTGLDDSEMNYIVVVKQQIDDLLTKLRSLKNISPITFSSDEKVEQKLKDLIINIELFDRLKADKTVEIIKSLNQSLNTVLEKVGILQGEVSKQKNLIKKLIEKHQKSINSFLSNAGYKYTVEIINNNTNDYKLLLKHIDSTETINGGNQFLSFGERNAFSLVLFMYEALHKKPELIVLDDPISSFDKNKKYAIMHMLFRGKSADCFLNKTVLMLTHDLDPVIDTVKVLKEFNNLSVASFISTSNGVLEEREIRKSNLLSFAQICKKTLESDIPDIIKLIYLRRHFEIIDDLGDEYEVLSNLFHKREKENCKDQRKEIGNDAMSELDFNNGITKIKQQILHFDYDSMLASIKDVVYLKEIYARASNNYTKLNIFRLIYDANLNQLPNVLRKFINETYHIENELICQLDPNDYNLIPDFIIDDCDKYIIESN
ncbi:AAA family ATPase [Maribellus luteus]|uniref:AAA family ATPase n=1 Tax=Maribellus luteus TaxID=2305463 RepID=A0A399SWP5_9BACT|nr:AAA family ATPase [Maribellus luteus]RIJ46581.1 AAA family ATPase [Maribellus luteus]